MRFSFLLSVGVRRPLETGLDFSVILVNFDILLASAGISSISFLNRTWFDYILLVAFLGVTAPSCKLLESMPEAVCVPGAISCVKNALELFTEGRFPPGIVTPPKEPLV